MIGLAIVMIAALVGYRYAVMEIENLKRFSTLSLGFKAGIMTIGIGCSIIIVVCLMLWSGAI